MIEESEERFKTDEEIEELLAVIATKLQAFDGETKTQDPDTEDENIDSMESQTCDQETEDFLAVTATKLQALVGQIKTQDPDTEGQDIDSMEHQTVLTPRN